ncbi:MULTISPECIES: hypothetical protein [Sinorhizobium/Ensifer group]|uniref:hypothetical protein n=1 Tax=Sinorhizobium/Ensifer group TaxID=227292 RepID=UPI00071DFF09|nr:MULTISPECIES: hypothetical protein [Sinorhizobium/Ensifer group]MBV7516365.1 hypothetical protein [Ensifer sp. ENS12]
MFTRTKYRTVHFDEPFWMPGLCEMVAPGDYEVDEDEELIEGISWLAYRRVATLIKLPATVENKYQMRLVAIDPEELEGLIAVDRDRHAISLSPKSERQQFDG